MQAKQKAEEGKRVYEVGYLLVPTISAEQLSKEVEAIRAILDGQKVIHVSDGFPKEIRLAYEMLKVVGPKRSKYETAYFGWMKFQAEPASLKEIKKALDASEKVIRFLLIETVLENTLHGHKFTKEGEKREVRKSSTSEKEETKPEAVVEDLDKSIDKLVIE